MPHKLYNIMVPVDFTARTRWAITKAIELCNSFNCNVHLVHVTTAANAEQSLKKLEHLKSVYASQVCGEGVLEISVLAGGRMKQLAAYIDKYQMDLVITGLAKFNLAHRIVSSISISRLARKTNVPVLAVRSSGLVCHFKKIVLPVSGEIPMRQIRFAALLGRAFRSTVYFVSLRQAADGENKTVLDRTVEILESISTIPAQCIFLEGQNLAKSTLEFSKKINADLIMVNPIKEFRLPGLWNRITNNLLPYGSKIPVLTINKTD